MYTIDDRKCEYMNERRQKDKTEMEREEQEEKKEEGTLSTRRWMGIVLIIAGMYFGATGLSGAVLLLKDEGTAAVNGLVIFTGIIGILGIRYDCSRGISVYEKTIASVYKGQYVLPLCTPTLKELSLSVVHMIN